MSSWSEPDATPDASHARLLAAGGPTCGPDVPAPHPGQGAPLSASCAVSGAYAPTNRATPWTGERKETQPCGRCEGRGVIGIREVCPRCKGVGVEAKR